MVGPTASGKTALAVELALRTKGEVVSADSMQIYKEMDIGTAKPTLEEQKGVPHHLLDFLDISQSYSVAQYVEQARSCIQEIDSRGHLPILVGGTGLYVSSLLNHVQFVQEQTSPKVREELQKRLEREGVEALLEELRSYDPESAARLHPNNQKRILRAMEIYQTTGITMTEHIKRSRLEPSPYRHCVIGLTYKDRNILYQRINQRVDQMVRQGLPEAVSYTHLVYSVIQARHGKDHKLVTCFLQEKMPDAVLSCVDSLLNEGVGYNAIRGMLRLKGYEKFLVAGKHSGHRLRKAIITWKLMPWMYKSRNKG